MEGQSSVAPKCPPDNEWTVRHSPAHGGVLFSHEKGRLMNPDYNVKYVIPSGKCQTHRDKVCDQDPCRPPSGRCKAQVGVC